MTVYLGAVPLAVVVKRDIERCVRELHAFERRRLMLVTASRRLATGESPAVVEAWLKDKGMEVAR